MAMAAVAVVVVSASVGTARVVAESVQLQFRRRLWLMVAMGVAVLMPLLLTSPLSLLRLLRLLQLLRLMQLQATTHRVVAATPSP